MRRRRLDRKYPAPPPTPPDMVYAKRPSGKLELVPADALQRYCQSLYEYFDRASPEEREKLRQQGN